MLWEAQFGDFVNGAQIIIDQFIAAGLSKWRESTRLTLLLPHGYEGNGPEHSSARLERFLQLAAQENIRIANCTTSGQYFHLLRRQALDATASPLVVMTPKGLLRLKQAGSMLEDLASGEFRPVLDDPGSSASASSGSVLSRGRSTTTSPATRSARRRPVWRSRGSSSSIPFPGRAGKGVVAQYPNLRELVWAQEEPQNMGAWRAIRHRLEETKPENVPLSYIGSALARQPE